jgi:hypothetical protein
MAKKRKGGEPFVQIFRSVVNSYAWRAASRSCQLVIERVLEEHMAHAGRENGNLPVTTDDFLKWGIDEKSLSAAEREAVALGLLYLSRRGRGGNAEHRSEHRWGIPFLKDAKGRYVGMEWKGFGSLAEARRVAKAARKQKNTWAVEQGRKRHKRYQEQRQVIPFPNPRLGGEAHPRLGGEARKKTADS